MPGHTAPLGFPIRRDSLFQLSLSSAARGKQVHQGGADPQNPGRKHAERCFDPHRIPVAQGFAMLLEQANESTPILGLACQVDCIKWIDVWPGKKRIGRSTTQVSQAPVTKFEPKLPE